MSLLIQSPLGPLGFDVMDGAITTLKWGAPGNLVEGALADRLRHEFGAYFEGKLQRFTIPLAPKGSEFQTTFYAALCDIPYGRTRTYGEMAVDLKVSPQAIGQACGANPIAILIPCHRVLAADGLGGYSGVGGIEAKVALLKLEGAGSLLI